MASDLRRSLYLQLDPSAWPKSGMSVPNVIISALVTICVISVVLETEPALANRHAGFFEWLNRLFLYAFTLEYLLRVWVMAESPRYQGRFGSLRYMLSFAALVDLITVLPFWFGAGSEILLMRMLRLMRILKLAKVPGISNALQELGAALRARRIELILSMVFAFLLMLVAATTLYFIEGEVQPDAFGSIPRALWWGMATLTTVGYGDVFPVTVLGKVAAGIYAFAGIGMVAMPTGIFAAAMSEIVSNKRREGQ